jgi:prophage DNA circulation protein
VASSLAESFAAVVSFTAEVTAVYADGVTRLQAVTSAMRQTLRKVQGVIDTVESVTATIKEVEADVAGLLALPGQLATSVVNAYKALGQAIAGINDAVSSALDTFGLGANTDELARRAPTSGGRLSARHRADLLANLLVDASSFGADLPVIAETTSSRVQLNTNRRAFERLVKVGTLIGVSTGLAQPGMTFEDRDQILTLRDAVSDAVDDLLADPELDDDLFNALRDLQVTVHGYLSRLVVALPDLMLYTSPGTIPTLVVAHQLYQDPEREFELIARNPAIHHPGFVPGGEALRVLDV